MLRIKQAVARRAALGLLAGVAGLSFRPSSSEAAYGETAKIFGSAPTNATGAVPYVTVTVTGPRSTVFERLGFVVAAGTGRSLWFYEAAATLVCANVLSPEHDRSSCDR